MYRYAQVALGLPVDKTFTYSVPKVLQKAVKIGQRVEVPFGKKLKIGYIVGLMNRTGLSKVKPLQGILAPQPLLTPQMLKLTRKIAEYYCASWGEAIEAAYPANVRKRKRPLHILENPHPGFDNLEANQAMKKLSLSRQQKQALRLIVESISKRRQQTFLLHGITASGKTEVYLQAIAEVLAQGRSSIVLVPEISLTPQTVERFSCRFGGRIALMHSRLSANARTHNWQMIKNGQAQIVIGARSAVFAPVTNLGLIVVDEEHETTYKQQDSTPRYHAREVAMLRARLAKATVILGSATPSLESFYNAKQGKIELLSLPERVTKRDLPQVVIVDMRKAKAERKSRLNIFSYLLERKIEQCLGKQQQVILFLNRRGFSTFINCAKCGYVAKCKHCNVSLTYHYATKRFICHYCNYSITPLTICPQCNCNYLRYFGLGTEKVESELYRLFPQVRIARMDTDITAKKDAHINILKDFQEGKIDILIGTQMIAKGLDFPRVGLVGVVCADTALNLPDFRSGERTFNLLTQVAGRAGRGEQEGQVIIQTYVPEHFAIAASIRHDYYQFYRREIKSREELALPPFTHLVNLTLRGKNQERLRNVACDLAMKLEKKSCLKGMQILGPAPAVISKIKGSFCWNILLKGKRPLSLVKTLRNIVPDLKRYKGMLLTINVDPL